MQDEMIHHRWHFHRKYKLTSQQFHVAINLSNRKNHEDNEDVNCSLI